MELSRVDAMAIAADVLVMASAIQGAVEGTGVSAVLRSVGWSCRPGCWRPRMPCPVVRAAAGRGRESR